MRVNLYYFICPVCKKYIFALNQYQLAHISKEHYLKHGITKTIEEVMKEINVKTIDI
ncbi:MAG: hypothetical protein QW726_03810 [Fervidicoccaceae archaeon]